MRLCYVKFNYAPPYAGGGSRMLATLLRHLARAHEVHVVTHTQPGYEAAEEMLDDVQVHRIALRSESYRVCSGLFFLTRARRLIANLHTRRPFDVVHTLASYPFFGAVAPLLVPRGARGCFTWQAAPLSWRDILQLRRPFQLTALFPTRPWIGALHRTFVVSENAQRMLRRRHVPLRRVAMVPPPIDCDEFHPYAGAPASRDFLFASFATEWKGVGDLIDAAAILAASRRDFRIRLLYPQFSPQLCAAVPAFERRAHACGIAQHLDIIREPLPDVPALMRAARAVVAPFRTMVGTVDVPLSLLEGAASGVPLIATTFGGVSEILCDGENGFVVPARNPVALAACMERLLDDDELCRRMGRRGRKRAELFEVSRVAQLLLSHYQGSPDV